MTNLDTADVTPQEEAEIAAPVEDGQGAVEATEVVVDETPTYDEADFLDTSELGDRPVRLTVNGQERVVPLSDVLSGYNSNSAATHKFQEASALREEAERSKAEAAEALNLARAVQNDPGMTMRVLASQAGLSVEQFLNLSPQQQQSVATAAESEEPEFNDPLEKALYEERQARVQLEQRISAQEQQYEQQRAGEVLRNAVGQLQSQFGATDEDAHSVVRQAYEMHVGPEMFPMIFQAQQYQKSQVQTQAQTEAQAAAAAVEAQRQAAAAQAGAVIGAGTGAVGTAPEAVAQQSMSVSEAVESALNQHGWTG